MSFIFLLNLVLSFIAVGLIWTIQLVHYPSMKFIPKERFVEYHNFHSMTISILAMPLMFAELVTSLMLFYQNFNNAFSKFGAAEIRLFVYSFLGELNISKVLPYSTSFPDFITKSLVVIDLTKDKS